MNHKNKYKIMAVAMSGLFMLIGSSASFAQSPAALKELGDSFEGRWLVEVTWAVDYPGLGKKGEKVTGVQKCRWILDGQAFEIEWYAGKTTGKYTMWWDSVSNQIKTMGVDSSGRWSEGTMVKRRGTFEGKAKGNFVDGEQAEYEWKVTFEDGGITRIHEGVTIVKGKRNPWRDVFPRVD